MIKLWLKWFGLKVEVSAEDIRKGQQPYPSYKSRASTCAIAQALQRKFKTADVAWGFSHGHADTLNFAVSDRDAKKVLNFVDTHDSKKPVQPFSFKIKAL